MSQQIPALFPVFLKLEGRRVVLVGGGAVASARLPMLLGAGADVAVVAPEVSASILASGVAIARRAFAAADLDGAWFVVAAATPDVNRDVAAAAEARRIFVNAVDDAERASAYTGGVVRRGGVTLAVSTEGQAPALAGLLREGIEAVIPEGVDDWIATARRLRAEQRGAGVPLADRRPALLRALNELYASRGGPGEGAAP